MQTPSTGRTRLSRLTACVAAVALGALLAAATPASAQTAAAQGKIIISGAAGHLGMLTVRDLLARGVPARDLILVSRTPDKLAEFAKLGASTRFGDFSKPESLPAAFAGGTRMLLISIGGGAGPRPAAHKRAIDAAVAAGVRQIAYTSYLAISRGATTGLAADHVQTEKFLRDSGIAWTMLRNSIYTDTLIARAAKMVADGHAAVPAQDNPIAYVTRADCAAAAAAVLSTPGHDNKVYNITGPELIGQRQIAAAASAVTGKHIDDVAADPNAKAPHALDASALRLVSDDVAKLTGRPATSVRAFFQQHKNELLGAAR